ncbi:MAG: nitrous oxide-stimulated promoter family protein [Bacteroidales bacterium]|nr:nitrous oxide-stimulated promoter family protein [Bacteroidales bacterium]
MNMTRIEREKKTVNSMIALYCKAHHHPVNGLCGDCNALVAYSNARLDRCRFGEEKTVCSKCPVHCYKPDRRQEIKVVMRYAGPRMMLHRPWLAIRHWVDTWSKTDSSAKSVAGTKPSG